MKKSKNHAKLAINETLNEILLHIFTGIDYATKIALQTHKSIPVVYRQLDTLVGFGILKKHRSGKTMTYSVDWLNLSDIVTSSLFLDIERVRKLTHARENESALVKELRMLINEVPKELFSDTAALTKLVKNFFSRKEAISLVQQFFRELADSEKENASSKRLSFDDTINLFIDTFGMLTKEQQSRFLAKKIDLKDDNVKYFIKYCRVRYLQRQLSDPRQRFLNGLSGRD